MGLYNLKPSAKIQQKFRFTKLYVWKFKEALCVLLCKDIIHAPKRQSLQNSLFKTTHRAVLQNTIKATWFCKTA